MINIFYSGENIEFVDGESYNIKINVFEDKVICHNEDLEKCFDFNKLVKFKDFVKKSVFVFLTEVTGKLMPWGTLTGIRPSKIALELINAGKNENEIIDYFKLNYCTNKDKAELCIRVANKEEIFVNKYIKNISVYIGMPFCPTRCLYCSFASNSVKSCGSVVDKYLETLEYEMVKMSDYIKSKGLNIQCVYFGGGTPTAIDDNKFRKVIENIHKYFIKGFDVEEFTVECGRADSITLDKLKSMKKFNATRISINPQTMTDKTLKLIGRNHTSRDVIEKFNMAREMGFNNINMDMIVGLPGEKLKDIINTCDVISRLDPESLTVHGLSVKRGSRLHENIINNENYEIANQKELNLMFEESFKASEKMDMKPYYMYRQKNMVGNMENVGYCKDKKESIYNIQMIEEKQTIIALGADAVSKVVFLNENRLERFANIKDVREYIDRIDEKIKGKLDLLDTLY
ncbi:coproporphyrinogen III oxidase [Haloimpatiens sp. FM7315]|uniref:coproporphyrinogen III oxidase n=1 Tax=Haloimpatiens sp. FM7315 TaxID=3298609 RepID=UPI0039779BC8